jgi:hypothetical protein
MRELGKAAKRSPLCTRFTVCWSDLAADRAVIVEIPTPIVTQSIANAITKRLVCVGTIFWID